MYLVNHADIVSANKIKISIIPTCVIAISFTHKVLYSLIRYAHHVVSPLLFIVFYKNLRYFCLRVAQKCQSLIYNEIVKHINTMLKFYNVLNLSLI